MSVKGPSGPIAFSHRYLGKRREKRPSARLAPGKSPAVEVQIKTICPQPKTGKKAIAVA